MKRRVSDLPGYHVPVPGFTTAVVVDKPERLLFISGITARDGLGQLQGVGDAGEQARVIYGNLQRILEQLGSSLDDIVRMVSYFVDMNDHPAVAAVREQFFPAGSPGASTSVQVARLFDERQLLEIEVTAVLPAPADTSP